MPPEFSEKLPQTGDNTNKDWQEALAILVYGKPLDTEPGAQVRQRHSARQTMATELERFCNSDFSIIDKNADGKLSYAELAVRPALGPNGTNQTIAGTLAYLRKEFDALKVLSDDETFLESKITQMDLMQYRKETTRLFAESTAKGCLKAIQDESITSLQSLLKNTGESSESVAKMLRQKFETEHYGANCTYKDGQFTVSLKGWRIVIPTNPTMKPMAWHDIPGGIFKKSESLPIPAEKALSEINHEIKRERDRKNFHMAPLPWIIQ